MRADVVAAVLKGGECQRVRTLQWRAGFQQFHAETFEQVPAQFRRVHRPALSAADEFVEKRLDFCGWKDLRDAARRQLVTAQPLR